MVRWPVGNSGKTGMRLSQHSTERGISMKLKSTTLHEDKGTCLRRRLLGLA